MASKPQAPTSSWFSILLALVVALLELFLLYIALFSLILLSPVAGLVVAVSFCTLGLVATITGRGLPRLRGRIKGASVFAVSGVFVFIALQGQVSQRETRWAELRQADPEAYLAELAPIDQERWFEELSELRPERYIEEVERRETELQAHRETDAAEQAEAGARAAEAAQRLIAGSDDLDEHHAVFAEVATELVASGTCTEAGFVENGGWVRFAAIEGRQIYFTDCSHATEAKSLFLDAATGNTAWGADIQENVTPAEDLSRQAAERLAQCRGHEVEAYTMIKSDVRRELVAPSTAEFPWRYGARTGHLGDCLYQVNGHFDAENGFGAMLRGTFTGTIRYFPETGSWQTQSLSIN